MKNLILAHFDKRDPRSRIVVWAVVILFGLACWVALVWLVA